MSSQSYPAWAREVNEVCQFHGVSADVGLNSDKVASKRESYGYNELTKPPGKPMWRLVLEQFDDMMVKVSSLLVGIFSLCITTAGWVTSSLEQLGVRLSIEQPRSRSVVDSQRY